MKGSLQKKKKVFELKQIRRKKLTQFLQKSVPVYSYPLSQWKIMITNSSTCSIQFPSSLCFLIQCKFFPLQFVSEN